MSQLKSSFLFFSFLFTTIHLHAQLISQPAQPIKGLGGADYVHESVKRYDFAQEPDGYHLYEPADPRPETAPVIVFVHGYGAYNPMIYGAWIKHLVRQGNIVIFPRYQKNLISPKPAQFSTNVSKGVRDALQQLKKAEHVEPLLETLIFVGHSYGAVISADLAVNYQQHQIPKIDALLMCSPGTGPFNGGILKDYKQMPEDVKMLVSISENDRTVGDKFGLFVYHSAQQVQQRNLIKQFRDDHGAEIRTAGHNESYALDEEFDNGIRNVSAKRALRIGKTDAMDFYGYWKLFDALIACTRKDEHCDVAFGNTPEQKDLGNWSDGVAIRPLEVEVPAKVIAEENN